jgi:dTDP-glucose 4,6-dehydratase
VEWYLRNRKWMEEVTSGAYQSWVRANYGQRGDAKASAAAPTGAR